MFGLQGATGLTEAVHARFPIIAVVGASNSGKTSIVCALTSHLASEGRIVAVAKHAPKGHDRGDEGTDSSRMVAAGARRVSVVSPGAVTRTESSGDGQEEELESIVRWATPCDVLILEGWKSSAVPKILVGDASGLDISSPVIATVDAGPPFTEKEVVRLVECIDGLSVDGTPPHITAIVDGVELRLKRFPAAALAGTIGGYIATLEDVPSDWSELDIKIRRS